MDPLASESDLLARNIVSPGAPVDMMRALESASAAIRSAAGSPISRETSTVTIGGSAEQWLQVPMQPARAVTNVLLDGAGIDDWMLVDGRLWRSGGWGSWCSPSQVTMTVDSGYDPVPADVVDLCCALVAASFGSAAGGYDPGRGVSSVSIDDYQESRVAGADEQVSVFELPQRTRDWLQQTYGSAVATVGTY